VLPSANKYIWRQWLGFSKAHTQVGLSFDRSGLNVVTLAGSPCEIDWFSHYPMTIPIDQQPVKLFSTGVVDACTQIAKKINQQAYQLMVSIPDPLIVFRRFQVDTPIKGDKAIQSYIEWRIAQEQGEVDAGYVSNYQIMHQDNNHQQILAQALPRSVMMALQTLFEETNLLPHIVDSNARFVFNHYYAQLMFNQLSGAMVICQTDYWTLMIWEEQGYLNFFRSHWYTQKDTEVTPQLSSIANTIEQTIKSYLGANERNQVENVFLTGIAQFRDELAPLLETKMTHPVILLETQVQSVWPIGKAIPDGISFENTIRVALS